MVKDKPLIHTTEENKDERHYHNVSDEKLFEGSRIIDLLFVIKQLKDGWVYSMWGIAECCIPRYQNHTQVRYGKGLSLCLLNMQKILKMG